MKLLDRLLMAAAAVVVVLTLAACAALGATLSMSADFPEVPDLAASPGIVLVACQEDEPCWTWATMGNRRRGVVLVDGRRQVVTCGTFRWLARHSRLDRRATPVLRGDWSCGR